MQASNRANPARLVTSHVFSGSACANEADFFPIPSVVVSIVTVTLSPDFNFTFFPFPSRLNANLAVQDLCSFNHNLGSFGIAPHRFEFDAVPAQE
jgi:hypothetical protein